MSYDNYYLVINIIIIFIPSLYLSLLKKKYNDIPNYKLGIIEHNIESTPIYDILTDDICEDRNKTSNVLGYYFGYEEGFTLHYENIEKIKKGIFQRYR